MGMVWILIVLAVAAIYLNRDHGGVLILLAVLAVWANSVVWNRRGNWPALNLTTIVTLLAGLVSVCLLIYKLTLA
jgi:hypothetical protein